VLAGRVDFDLALVDLNMRDRRHVDHRRWRREHPTLPLVILSATEDPSLVRELIALGVSGFVPKSDAASVMLQAIRLILAGGTYAPLRFSRHCRADKPTAEAVCAASGLTGRQIEVLRLLAADCRTRPSRANWAWRRRRSRSPAGDLPRAAARNRTERSSLRKGRSG